MKSQTKVQNGPLNPPGSYYIHLSPSLGNAEAEPVQPSMCGKSPSSHSFNRRHGGLICALDVAVNGDGMVPSLWGPVHAFTVSAFDSLPEAHK